MLKIAFLGSRASTKPSPPAWADEKLGDWVNWGILVLKDSYASDTRRVAVYEEARRRHARLARNTHEEHFHQPTPGLA